MPTIEIELEELRKLVGDKLPTSIEELEQLIFNLKGEIESFENGKLILKMSDGNRPELWSPEGLAREIKGIVGIERGAKEYFAKTSDLKVFVSTKLEKIRPFIACAAVKGIKLSDSTIRALMQTQTKIDSTLGRERTKASVGLYNLKLIKFPLKYTTTKPHENAFVPLGYTQELPPHEILKNHPKGQQYGHILKGLPEYPILLDASNKVLSLPPIINSADLGKITEQTQDILVEVTGTDYETVQRILTIFCTALAERGGEIYSITIDYPYRKPDMCPHLETSSLKLDIKEIQKTLGINLLPEDVIKLLQRARYSAKVIEELIEVKIPCYRKDIMHPIDLIEDIAIAYGLNNLSKIYPELPTRGKESELEKCSAKFREICIGLGAQEILSFILTNKENLFAKMACPEEKIIEIENPMSLSFYACRSKLLPSLLDFLAQNTTKPFPQKIFEIGDIVFPNSKSDMGYEIEKRLALAISHSEVDFTEIKQNLEALYRALGKSLMLEECEHPSFIPGRCAKIIETMSKKEIGILGEIHPKVLQNWGLEMPVAAFEIKICGN
ncbi:MAG: phenylalanine--tRNA ligase subunit beta [Candidatus Nanoarchaeia archaeon]